MGRRTMDRGLIQMVVGLPNTCNASWELLCSLRQFMECLGGMNCLSSNILNIGSGTADIHLPEGLIFSKSSQAWTSNNSLKQVSVLLSTQGSLRFFDGLRAK